jgi:hypothetical protein
LSLPNKRKEGNAAKALFSCVEGDAISYLNVYEAFLTNGKDPKWYLLYKDGFGDIFDRL